MIARLRNLAARSWRSLTASAVRKLPLRERAVLVEELLPGMIVGVGVKDREVRMVASTPLLLLRAQKLLTKERDTIRWIDGFHNDAVFWDIGANVGVFSLYAAMQNNTKVLAFEPGAANYDALCKNIQLNQLNNIRAYCLAFTLQTRLGVLNMSSGQVGAAINQFGDEGDVSPYAERSCGNVIQDMVGFSIDDFIIRTNAPFPNFLKIDVDGIEWSILQGAESVLRDGRLKSLLVEMPISHNAEYSQMLLFLEDCGFELVSKGDVQTAGGEQGCNHVFFRLGATRPTYGS